MLISRDGDWILRETPAACERVLDVLAGRGARYRPAPPLDVRWLRGGWSSQFEGHDANGLRIRCDFSTRPPRLDATETGSLFERAPDDGLAVVGIEPLVRLKRTQRAEDYALISFLAGMLSPERELALTFNPDRMLALVRAGVTSSRPAVEAAVAGEGREELAVPLAREATAFQVRDMARVRTYARAAEPYLGAFREQGIAAMPLRDAHSAAIELAEDLLPERHEPMAT